MSGGLALLAVALGGAVGGLLRVGVAAAVERWSGGRLPWGTLVVNVTGSGAIGVAAALLEGEAALPRAALMAGVLGAYTTVSAFAQQVHALTAGRRRAAAATYVGLSVALCLAAAAAGLALGGHWAGPG